MAVLEALPGIEVVVCTGGNSMAEYNAENDQIVHDDQTVVDHQRKVTVTKYIESVTGQEFTIELRAKHPYTLDCPALEFYVYVDGKFIQGLLMRKQEFQRKAYRGVVEGPYSQFGKTIKVHLMKFAAIKTTSKTLRNETINKQKEAVSQWGEITVTIRRVSVDTVGKIKEFVAKEFGGSASTSLIHEKALKGESKSHGLSLGASKQAGEVKTFKCHPLDGLHFPTAIFRFKYRSREALQSLHIIQRSPSPESEVSPSTNTQNLGNLSPEELVQLQQLLQRAGEGNAGLLRSGNIKKAPSSPSREQPIKREGEDNNDKSASKRRRRLTGKITIDLTEDDIEDREIVPVD